MHLRTFRETSFGGDGFFSRRAEGGGGGNSRRGAKSGYGVRLSRGQ